MQGVHDLRAGVEVPDEVVFCAGVLVDHGDLDARGVAVGVPACGDVEPCVERRNHGDAQRDDERDGVAGESSHVAPEDSEDCTHDGAGSLLSGAFGMRLAPPAAAARLTLALSPNCDFTRKSSHGCVTNPQLWNKVVRRNIVGRPKRPSPGQGRRASRAAAHAVIRRRPCPMPPGLYSTGARQEVSRRGARRAEGPSPMTLRQPTPRPQGPRRGRVPSLGRPRVAWKTGDLRDLRWLRPLVHIGRGASVRPDGRTPPPPTRREPACRCLSTTIRITSPPSP